MPGMECFIVKYWSRRLYLHKAVLSLCTDALWLLQQPQPQCHPSTAMQGTATVLLKHELKHLLSGTYHTVIVKDMARGLGFRGQGVSYNLRPAIAGF